MIEVVISLKGEEILRKELSHGKMILGRDKSVDLHLNNKALSRRHVEFLYENNEIHVQDLGSQNGTYLNDQLLSKPSQITSEDQLEVGNYVIQLFESQQNTAQTLGTPVLTLTGPEGQHRFAVMDPDLLIGRSPTCDIAIAHKSISREHFRIFMEGNHFFCEDLGSQNGTKINGERFKGIVEFSTDDLIQASDFKIQLSYLEQTLPEESADRGSKTMMIDPAELAKGENISSDRQLNKPEVPFAGNNPESFSEMNWGAPTNVGFSETNDHKSIPSRGLPSADPENSGPTRSINSPEKIKSAPNKKQAPIKKPIPNTKSSPNKKPTSIPSNEKVRMRISLSGKTIKEKKLNQKSYLLSEEGLVLSADDKPNQLHSKDGIIFIHVNGRRVIANVIGDRRLLIHNKEFVFYAELKDKDIIELGQLSIKFTFPSPS